MLRVILHLLIASLAILSAETRTLTILHTNDLHARLLPDEKKIGGFAYVAGALNEARRDCRDCLTLDAGDLVQGSPISTIYQGLPIYEVANSLGIQVSTLGNHEFDYGWQKTKLFEKTARFPILNANVVDQQNRPLARRQWVIRKVNGLRIGLIGVLMGDLEKLATPTRLGPYHSIDPVAAIKPYLAQLERRTHLIVVLAHTSPKEAERILTELPQVHAVINGHDHSGQKELVRIGDRVVARVRGYAQEIGMLKLTVDRSARRITAADWKARPIDAATIPPDPRTAQLVASWESRVAEKLDVVIGEAKRDFASRNDLVPFVERAIRDQLNVDIAFQNSGGIRDRLSAGPITERKIWTLLPFDNALVWGKFKGSQLPEFIRQRQPIDPDKVYTFATNDFIAETDNVQRWGNLSFPNKGPEIRTAVLDWIKKHKVIE